MNLRALLKSFDVQNMRTYARFAPVRLCHCPFGANPVKFKMAPHLHWYENAFL